MKNKIYMFFPVLILLSLIDFNCAVNDKTGCIEVKNDTYKTISNVKIGNTLIASYVAPGTYVNYWYYTNITGNLTLSGISLDQGIQNVTFNLKPDFWVYITASYSGDGTEIVTATAQKQGSSTTNPGDWQND